MNIDTVLAATLKIANSIAQHQYASAIQMCDHARMTEDDLKRVIEEYGRTFVQLPTNFGEYVDAVIIEVPPLPAWSVQVPLWTLEEGRSDLTLELTVTERIEGLIIELDDLRVL